MRAKNREKKLITAAMLVVAMIWGYGFVVTVKAMEVGYTASFILLFRFGITAVVFGILARKDMKDIGRGEVTGGILSGLFLFAGFALQNYGLPLTTPSNSALVTSSNVIFIAFFVWIVFKKPPTKMVILGSILCFVGVCILTVDFTDISSFGIGDFLTFLCAIGFALQNVTMSYFIVRGRGKVLNFIQMLTAAACSFVLFLVAGDSFRQFVPRLELLWVVYLVVLSTIVAFFVQTKALFVLRSSSVAIITASESIFAAIFSLLYGYEKLSLKLLVGGVLVFVAIIIVEKPQKAKNIQKKPFPAEKQTNIN